RITYMDWQGRDLWNYLETVTSFPVDAGAYLQYHKLAFTRKNGKLVSVLIDGKPLDENKTYRMSLNSYNASGGDGYPAITKLKGFVSTDETDAQALKTFVSQNSPLKAAQFAPK
ncbi:MAG: bifunctional UDP-sugar hydrolase/5'-nucleotidase, partial [Pseudoalteromonas sp.]|nr:bifunctional UDP-sugar hydrolase/5'-nucleotidase [Pseudoalteromonas sp.]